MKTSFAAVKQYSMIVGRFYLNSNQSSDKLFIVVYTMNYGNAVSKQFEEDTESMLKSGRYT